MDRKDFIAKYKGKIKSIKASANMPYIDYTYPLGEDAEVVRKKVIESLEEKADYTEDSFKKETQFDFNGFELIHEAEGEIEATVSDNTYNSSYLGTPDFDIKLVPDPYGDDDYYLILSPHLGGDIRGRYGEAVIWKISEEEFNEKLFEILSIDAIIEIEFTDGSGVEFRSESFDDMWHFEETNSGEGIAEEFLSDLENVDTYHKDEVLIELVEKLSAKKMREGGEITGDGAKIYVVSLYDYNKGETRGDWFEFSHYPDAETMVAAIEEMLQDIQKEHGGALREEWIVTDYEGFPKFYYSEGMGEQGIESIFELLEIADGYDMDAVDGYIKYGHTLETFQDAYMGEADNEEDYAREYVDNIGGLENLSNPEYYIDMYPTDKRIYAGEESDARVENMDAEDIFSELGREYNEDTTTEEQIDEAKEELKEKFEDEILQALNDPHDYFVEEQGIYTTAELAKASFITVDYEKLAHDLFINDLFSVDGDGKIYVFNRHV